MGVMSGPYVIRGSVSLPEAELMWRFSRSSGPGGQHVNTSDSQVELRFDLAATDALPEVWKARALERLAGLVGGVVSVRASEHRSQWRNRETAAVRLAALLAEATAPPPKPRIKRKIPRGINERLSCARRRRAARPSAAARAATGRRPGPCRPRRVGRPGRDSWAVRLAARRPSASPTVGGSRSRARPRHPR